HVRKAECQRCLQVRGPSPVLWRGQAGNEHWLIHGDAIVEKPLDEFIGLWQVFAYRLDQIGFHAEGLLNKDPALAQIDERKLGSLTNKQGPHSIERRLPARWIERAVIDAADQVGQILV